MRVTYVDPEPPAAFGGIRTYLRLALAACRARGIEARVYTHEPSAFPGETALPIGRAPLAQPWRFLGYRLCYPQNVLFEHALWLARELEAKDAPDDVHEFADFLGYAFFALRSARLRERVTLRVHTPNFLVDPSSFLGRWREKSCLDRARHITAPSAAFVRENLPSLRGWEHLPNPLPEPAPMRPQGSENRILFLGRVEERKGPLVLLRAFRRMAEEIPDATLTLVGGEVPGAYALEVRSFIDSLPGALRARVAWEPPRPPEARAALLSGFDVLAVPSLWENSPYVYFEGMAAGLVCVGSATGEMREAAHVTGGLLAPPGDEAGLAQALRKACSPGGRRERIAAQRGYLSDRAAEIPERLIAHYRRLLEAAR